MERNERGKRDEKKRNSGVRETGERFLIKHGLASSTSQVSTFSTERGHTIGFIYFYRASPPPPLHSLHTIPFHLLCRVLTFSFLFFDSHPLWDQDFYDPVSVYHGEEDRCEPRSKGIKWGSGLFQIVDRRLVCKHRDTVSRRTVIRMLARKSRDHDSLLSEWKTRRRIIIFFFFFFTEIYTFNYKWRLRVGKKYFSLIDNYLSTRTIYFGYLQQLSARKIYSDPYDSCQRGKFVLVFFLC